MNRSSSYRIAAFVAGVTLLAGCTAADEQTTAPESGTDITSETDVVGSEPSTAEPEYVVAFREPDADDFNKLLDSEDSLAALQPAAILNLVTTSPTELVLSFEMESHHCFAPRMQVAETESEITVELWTGQRIGIDPTACTYGVYPYTLTVELDAPVGDRTISLAEPQEPEQTSTNDETGDTMPDAVAKPAKPAADDSGLVGEHVEDAVEWAIEQDLEWRILSYDGVAVEDSSATDSDRISFVVERDRVVSYEWS